MPLQQKVSSTVIIMMLIADNMDSTNYVIFTTSRITTNPTFVKIVSRLQFHFNISTYLFFWHFTAEMKPFKLNESGNRNTDGAHCFNGERSAPSASAFLLRSSQDKKKYVKNGPTSLFAS